MPSRPILERAIVWRPIPSSRTNCPLRWNHREEKTGRGVCVGAAVAYLVYICRLHSSIAGPSVARSFGGQAVRTSKADFDNWFGLPKGAFVARPWPFGPDNEPLARTDLSLLRSAQVPDSHMTPREQKRASAAHTKSYPKSDDDWPALFPAEVLEALPYEHTEQLYREINDGQRLHWRRPRSSRT